MPFQSKLCILNREGVNIFDYDLIDSQEKKLDGSFQKIVQSLFTTMKNFGFPEKLIFFRYEQMEARCISGKDVSAVLLIESSSHLNSMVEPILAGIITEATTQYEQKKKNFKEYLNGIIEKYALEGSEIYQKMIIIEGIYANIPQEHLIPLLEKTSAGDDIIPELEAFPERWRKKLRDVVEKVNNESQCIWDLFSVPLFHP